MIKCLAFRQTWLRTHDCHGVMGGLLWNSSFGGRDFWTWTISYRRNTYWQSLNTHFINRMYQPNVDKLGRICLDILKAKVSLAFEISRARWPVPMCWPMMKDIGGSGRQRKRDYRSGLIIKCISFLLFSQYAFLLLHLVLLNYYRIKFHIPSRQWQKKSWHPIVTELLIFCVHQPLQRWYLEIFIWTQT